MGGLKVKNLTPLALKVCKVTPLLSFIAIFSIDLLSLRVIHLGTFYSHLGRFTSIGVFHHALGST